MDKELKRLIDGSYRKVEEYLAQHYPVGSVVEFNRGRSRLCGIVEGNSYQWANFGGIRVRILKKDGLGSYCLSISPSFIDLDVRVISKG